MAKRLIAYFSAGGVTQIFAKRIAQLTEADMYEIKPEVLYTKKDLNYMNPLSRSSREMHRKSFRPPLADTDANIQDYDEILIGFPIWWYVAPTIINTFLEAYDFSGKKIKLFATSGGSGMGKTLEGLKPSAPNAVWCGEKRFEVNAPVDEIKAFIEDF